jgi:nucleoside-diphosphate-sugar epimerase
VPAGATAVVGNALDATTFASAVTADDTIVHLVGTPHPSPKKAAEFQRVDLPSILASVDVARRMGAAHLVYVSVAHPAPVMDAYIAVRSAGEHAIADAGLTAIARLVPSKRETAERLGLVTIRQMIDTLVRAIENPPPRGNVRIVDVPRIKKGLA